MNCSHRQRRRARATSGRCCSAACRLFFFEGEIMSSKKPPDRGAATRNAPLAHRGDDLVQHQIRLLGNHSQQPLRVLLQRRRAASARLCFGASCVTPALQPFTAELGLRLKLSAASRRDAPASTASTTRSRKSSEYGFGIAWDPQKTNQCCQTRPSTRPWESLRFNPAETCSKDRFEN
jgi:hypothetical protein